MAGRKVLVVTGDYDTVQQVKNAVGGYFSVYPAYSHLDAVYQLRYDSFDLLLCDAAMTNRKTNELTAVTLSEFRKRPPLLVYAPAGQLPDWSPESVVVSLEHDLLRGAISRLLNLPIAPAYLSEQPTEPDDTNMSVFWRDDEMQTLFALGRSLTEVLELSEVLNRVVEAARRLTNAEEGMILLPDGQSGELYLRAKVGIEGEAADNFRIKTQDTIAGTVFQMGQPMLVAESGPQKVKTEYFVNALLYVPIIHKGQTLGVLGVNNKQKHDIFTERHRDLLVNLASYAAVAIENARIHGQSIRRAHELKALIDASQVINASLSFDRTLPAICDQFIRVLNVGCAQIYQWDAAAGILYLLAYSRQARWRSGFEPVTPIAERPTIQQALNSHRHLFMGQGGDASPAEREHLAYVGAAAALILPIGGGDRAIGTLLAYYVQPPPKSLPPDAVYLAQRIMLEGLASLAGEGDLTHSFKPLSDACAALGADWSEFALLTPDQAALRTVYAVGRAVWNAETAPELDVRMYPDLLEALEQQKPLNYYQNDDAPPPGVRSLFALTGSRSLLALPLIVRGQTQGMVLFADTLHAKAFSPREVDLGRAIVGQAATAWENVSLVRDLEASLHELKETQNRLIQAARLSAMGELAAAVAHQINNPLTTIVLDTELLLERQLNAADQEALLAISRSGKRAAGVVRRLLAMARPNAPDIPQAAIDVGYTIEETISLVRPHLEREGIEIALWLPDEPLPNVRAAPGELDDIWLNLVLNAHDVLVGRYGARIALAASYDAAHGVVEVDVRDNGPGIPEAIADEIFKPFFTTKPLGEGTGLGLHICRQVVDRIGGTITVQSSSEGTQFRVRLPIMRSS